MIPNDKSLSGSIVLERGTSFLSKQIILHMAIYARQTGRKPLKFSHAECLVWNYSDSTLYTIGARAKGTERTKVQDYYYGQEILILKPKKELTITENFQLRDYYLSVDASKYQYGNFIAWISFLKRGWWLSKSGDRRVYCYELAARFANAIGRWPKGKGLDMVTSYDLYENMNYEIWQGY